MKFYAVHQSVDEWRERVEFTSQFTTIRAVLARRDQTKR